MNDTSTAIDAGGSRKGGAHASRHIGHFVLALLAMLLPAMQARSQEPLRTRFGVVGQGALSMHDADFIGIPGTQSCCVGFTGGTGTGFGAGLLAEFPLGGSLLFGGRVALLTQPFTMTTTEPTFVIVNGVGEAGAFEHRLEGSMMTVGVEPTLGMRLFESFFLYAGVRAGIVVNSSYDQKEQLTQPTGSGTFINSDGSDSRMRTRNAYSGALPDPALQIAPLAGISYELPVSAKGDWILAPEISYQLGVTNVLKDVDWKVSTLRVGIALKYSPIPGKPHITERREVVDTVRVTVPVVARAYARGVETSSERTDETDATITTTELVRRVDTLFLEAPRASNLAATVSAVGVKADGTELPLVRLTVEEFSSTLMTPLLHYVFFEESSDRIPGRYNALGDSEVELFDIDGINSPERLKTYHHLLNIVGRRLRDNPRATITLTGCNQDIRSEKGDVALSRRRAEAVRDYLVGTWSITPSRIKIESRNLPAKAANTQTDDGSQENRRVEIASDDPRILEPIITNDTLRRVDPPQVRFRMSATADAGVASWRLTAVQGGTTLKQAEGNGAVPAVYDWNIAREWSSVPRTDQTLGYDLTVVDRKGKETRTGNQIPVELVTVSKKRRERRGDMEIDRFSLILFDVRSSALLPAHGPIVTLIKRYIEPNSTVTVTGFTDRLGDAEYNQQLARSRASTVEKALRTGRTNSSGIAEADLFDSSLPEGRLYTRTVDVIIETPVKE